MLVQERPVQTVMVLVLMSLERAARGEQHARQIVRATMSALRLLEVAPIDLHHLFVHRPMSRLHWAWQTRSPLDDASSTCMP
jgi:hypothetical protein